MTVLLLALATTLALSLASFEVSLASAAGARTRAQLAADAAALAAVAASGPAGGDPEALARSYARANGASVVSCSCRPGATTATVRVALGEARATARAVLDARLLRPQATGFDHRGLDPRLASAVDRLLAAGAGAVTVSSGYRSPNEQATLFSEAVRRYGSAEAADDWVAPPGTSMHERGLAVDLAGDLELAVRLIHELGLPLHRPLPHEPWHFELFP